MLAYDFKPTYCNSSAAGARRADFKHINTPAAICCRKVGDEEEKGAITISSPGRHELAVELINARSRTQHELREKSYHHSTDDINAANSHRLVIRFDIAHFATRPGPSIRMPYQPCNKM